MNQELEIEFKNALTEEEYLKIIEEELDKSNLSRQITFQTNYYFDTMHNVLKNQGSVLRVRVTDSFNECTFKVPSQGFLLEMNYPLNNQETQDIIQAREINLSSFISSSEHLPKLEDISIDTKYYLFNQFSTKRLEKQMGNHLVVLDQTTFQNGVIDYELEIESLDAQEGQLFFNSFLAKYGISHKPSLPKIARAEKNRQPFL